MATFRRLDLWQKAEGWNDAKTAAEIGVGKGVFSRFRNGLQTLKMRHLLRFEAVTGITPAECAEFYAEAVRERAGVEPQPSKKNDAASLVEEAV